MSKAQHDEQNDEGKQHPDDDIQLMHRQGEFIVHLLFGVDEVGVVVVQQALMALRGRCTGCFKVSLVFFQLSLPGRQSGFPPGQLRFAGSLFVFGHNGFLLFFLYYNKPGRPPQ